MLGPSTLKLGRASRPNQKQPLRRAAPLLSLSQPHTQGSGPASEVPSDRRRICSTPFGLVRGPAAGQVQQNGFFVKYWHEASPPPTIKWGIRGYPTGAHLQWGRRGGWLGRPPCRAPTIVADTVPAGEPNAGEGPSGLSGCPVTRTSPPHDHPHLPSGQGGESWHEVACHRFRRHPIPGFASATLQGWVGGPVSPKRLL